MKIKDVQKYLDETSVEDIDVDVFELIERDEFAKTSVDNYRESAIDKALALNLGLHSTANNICEISNRFISVFCPRCGTETKQHGGGGSGTEFTINFWCSKCREKTISITFQYNAIRVPGKEK